MFFNKKFLKYKSPFIILTLLLSYVLYIIQQDKNNHLRHIKIVASIESNDSSSIYLFKGSKELKISPLKSNQSITPKFSNNGDLIAYSTKIGNYFQIFIYDVLKDSNQQITFQSKDHLLPKWSPNDEKITFISIEKKNFNYSRTSNIGIYNRINKNYSEIDNNNFQDVFPVFIDNELIVFESGIESFGLFSYNLKTRLLKKLIFEPEISANGIPSVFKDYIFFEKSIDKQRENYNNAYIKLSDKKSLILLKKPARKTNTTPVISKNGNFLSYQYREKENENFKVIVDKVFYDDRVTVKKHLELKSKTDSYVYPLFSNNSKFIIFHNFKNIFVANLKGKITEINLDQKKIRSSRFMELWNFDIF